jgi:hypothetical protein
VFDTLAKMKDRLQRKMEGHVSSFRKQLR